MEHMRWKKDTTPYLIFACMKCQQYIYMKTTQKSKKCLRCGRSHQVKLIQERGEVVYGISKAVDRVKELQNNLGQVKLSAEKEFAIISRKKIQEISSNESLDNTFHALLKNLSAKYNEFPLYLIKIMAEDYQIPCSEIDLLIKRFIKERILISLKNRNFQYIFKI
ncbi:MAG: DUF1922 domain-containing protein [Candidatus Hodarchaeota archaeon]